MGRPLVSNYCLSDNRLPSMLFWMASTRQNQQQVLGQPPHPDDVPSWSAKLELHATSADTKNDPKPGDYKRPSGAGGSAAVDDGASKVTTLFSLRVAGCGHKWCVVGA